MPRLLLVLGLALLLTACSGGAALPAPATPPPGVAKAALSLSQPTTAPVASPSPASAKAISLAPREDATATPEPERAVFKTYTIQAGDNLSSVAVKLGISIAELVKVNGITDPNKIRIGQVLKVPDVVELVLSGDRLLPDSEIVFGPTAKDFNIAEFVSRQPGYLQSYEEEVEGRVLNGPQIVYFVAQRFSVNPRLLLVLLEMKGGWLSNPSPSDQAKVYPLGKLDAGRAKLFKQLSWAANQVNEGYYSWKGRQRATLTFKDGTKARINNSLNSGTIAVQFLLAQEAKQADFNALVAKDGEFARVYARLFGDPFARAADPTLPPGLKQPEFKLPWTAGDRWFYSGGPHGAWGAGSAWAALDFIPGTENLGGCWDASAHWVTASAPGLVVRSYDGEVVVDLDGDGSEATGWNILYMHVHKKDRVAVGTRVKAGDRIGHPSCEGGFSNGTHLHIARKYNGEWMAADGPVPFVLSGWAAKGETAEYDGYLVNGSDTKESCECRIDSTNGLLSDNK